MVNLWSGSGDDSDAVEYDYHEGVPTEPAEVIQDNAGVASVTIENVVIRGKTNQYIVDHTPFARWTKSDLSQAAYMGYVMADRAGQIDRHSALGAVKWNRGLYALGDGYLRSSTGAEIPRSFADLFDGATLELLRREGRGGGRHRSQAEAFLLRRDAERHPCFEEKKTALANFLEMRVWKGDEEPNWIGFSGAGKWLVCLPNAAGTKAPGKKAAQMLENLPEGTCAVRAMLYSGISYKNFLDCEMESWKGATVGQMVEVLDRQEEPYGIYDTLGRLVLKKTPQECRNPRKGHLPVHKFMVGSGHVYAFTARGEAPLKLLQGAESPEGRFITRMKKLYPLMGANGMEVHIFAEGNGIRPPTHFRSGRIQGDLRLDCNKAYFSILGDETNIFPIPSGMEVIHEYEERQLARSDIARTGFYRASAMPLLTCCPPQHEEVTILFGGQREAWVYGDVLLRAYPDAPQFRITGDFVPQGAKGATTPAQLQEAWPEIAQIVADMLEHDGEEVTADAITKRFFGTFVKFTGILEKTDFRQVKTTTKSGPDPSSEWAYHQRHSEEALDVLPNLLQDTFEFTQFGYSLRTGVLAKHAVYQYMSLSLVRLWRELSGACHSLTSIKTDSMTVAMSHARIPGLLEHLRRKGIIGPHVGQYKVEWDASADASQMESAFRSRLEPQAPRCSSRYMAVGITRLVGREDVIEQAASGHIPGLAIFGPGGAGKTHLLMKEVLPRLETNGHQVVVLTPTLDNLSRLQEAASKHPGVICMTLQKFLTPLRDKTQLERFLRRGKVTVVVDEIGLATPAHLNALRRLGLDQNSNERSGCSLIVTGDHCQLSNAGDVIHAVTRLGLQVCLLEEGAHSRHAGCPKLREILRLLRKAIEVQRRQGLHQCESIGHFPDGLQKELEAAGLPMVIVPSPGTTLLGWRRRYSADMGGSTVHSTQGATIEGKVTITDYHCDPRLLYTAISRARQLADVEVCRTPPRYA